MLLVQPPPLTPSFQPRRGYVDERLRDTASEKLPGLGRRAAAIYSQEKCPEIAHILLHLVNPVWKTMKSVLQTEGTQIAHNFLSKRTSGEDPLEPLEPSHASGGLTWPLRFL